MKSKIIRDAVHGDIVLSPVEVELMDSIPFQRLRGIKQLGTSSLVFPSATHTRFDHSLGTCWLAKQMLEALRRHSGRADLLANQEQALAAAALLHDVTHIPFGHTFEDERRILPRHDESPERLDHFLGTPPLSKILESHQLKGAVLSVLEKGRNECDPDLELMRDIISGTVCADLLDYLKRDARFCGLNLDYDERLYRYLTVIDGRLVFDLQQNGLFRPDALSELIHLLRLRYTLTERVYYHHGKVIAGAMISRALELALKKGRLHTEELFHLRDDSLLWLLQERNCEEPEVALILQDLLSHRFYRCAYLLRPGGIHGAGVGPGVETDLERRFHLNADHEREQVETRLAESLGVPPSEVLLYCPSARMSLKEAHVQVKVDGGAPVSLADLHYPEVEVLLQKHRALWRFSIYLRRGRESLLPEAGRLCEEIIGERNMLSERSRK